MSPAKAAPSVFAHDISRPGIPLRRGLGGGLIQTDVATESVDLYDRGEFGVSSGVSWALIAGVAAPELRDSEETVRNDESKGDVADVDRRLRISSSCKISKHMVSIFLYSSAYRVKACHVWP